MRIITMAAVAAVTTGLAAGPAHASDAGLYGSQDATYDGVYRQSLSILALTAADRPVPTRSVNWLLDQQCANGSFESYRADPKTKCVRFDADAFTGVDSNASALAASALWALGEKQAARKAANWLLTVQGDDGGWSYFPYSEGPSDTNSTALAIGALKAVKGVQPTKYLSSTVVPCTAPARERGAFAFDTSDPTGNANSTSQVAWALTNGLALPKAPALTKRVPTMTCGQPRRERLRSGALGHMARSLTSVKGALPNGYGGIDYSGAASSAVALANAGVGRKAVRQTTGYLSKQVNTWARPEGVDQAGPLALLILVAESTDRDPTAFGGTNLVKRLTATRTR